MAENSQAVIPDNLIIVDGEIGGGVPSSSPSDAGKVLTVDSEGDPSWVTPSGGTQYSEGNGIDISNENVISVDTTVVATKNDLSGYQPTISDLETIRSGAAAGATAVQPSALATVATSGSYDDLTNKPSIPAAQVNADWDAVTGISQILNKPTIPTVDQSYNASSTNAQSGVAVAQAIASVPTTSYTAGDGIDIDANDEISAKLGNGLSIGSSSSSFNEQTVANTDGNNAYYLCKLDNKLISAIEGAGLTYTNAGTFYIGANKYYPVIAQFQTGDHPNKPDMNYYIKLEWSSQSCTSQNVPANTSFTVTTSKLNNGTITFDTVKQNPSNYCITYFSSTINKMGYYYAGPNAPESVTTGSVSGVGLVSGFITVDKPVPATQSSDNGKVLGVTDNQGTLGWVSQPTVPTVDQSYSASSTNAQSGTAVAQAIASIPSASYTAGDGIDISAQDEISVKAGNGITIADYSYEHTGTLNLTATPVLDQGSYFAPYIAQLTPELLAQMNSTGGLQVTLNGAYDGSGYPLYIGLATSATSFQTDLSNRVVFGDSLGTSIAAGTTVTFDFAERKGSLSTKSYADVAANVSSYYLVIIWYLNSAGYEMFGNAGQAAPSADPITTGTYTGTETVTVQNAVNLSVPIEVVSSMPASPTSGVLYIVTGS